MAIISLFFRRPQPTQLIRTVGGQIAPMILDATMKEDFTATAEMTKHPIEDGADATDHVILRPTTLSISGIITETPFEGIAGIVKTAGASIGAAIGSSLGVFGGVAGALAGAQGGKTLAGAIFGSSDRVLSAVSKELVAIRDARQPIDIQTGLDLYKSYILTSVKVGRDQKTGGSIKVDLEFGELILVTSQTARVPIPKVKGGLPGQNNGKQTPGELNSDQTTRSSSLLKQLSHGVGL